MKSLLAIAVLATCAFSSAQTPTTAPEPKVTIVAKGHDARTVLTDLFQQAKKSCVIQRNLQVSLYLSLTDTPFDTALSVICRQAGLVVNVEDGIYYIHQPAPKPQIVIQKTVTPIAKSKPTPLSSTVLARRVTGRFTKSSIREVLATFALQSNVKIEVDPTVPFYKLDVILNNTSLKYALDQVTKAAGLVYKLSDHGTIVVEPEESKVALVSN